VPAPRGENARRQKLVATRNVLLAGLCNNVYFPLSQATHDRQDTGTGTDWECYPRCPRRGSQGLMGMRERPPGRPAGLRKKEAWSATAPRAASSDTFFRTGMRPKPLCSFSYLRSEEAH